jgi:uncharacterized protein (TIGR02996 family)
VNPVPDAIRERLVDAPDDPHTHAVFADWLEENGFSTEATWLLDQRADMAALFRRQTEVVDPFPGVDPAWLSLQQGLVVGLSIPQRRASAALATCKVLAASPLAAPLVRLNALHGRDAAAWLPLVRRHLPRIAHVRLGPDVDVRLLDGFHAMRTLELAAVARSTPGEVVLPALAQLHVEVRGRRLDVLDALSPAAVDVLVLDAPRWTDVPTPALERFVARVPVGSVDVRGADRALVREVLP